jgi:hypothetical protein
MTGYVRTALQFGAKVCSSFMDEILPLGNSEAVVSAMDLFAAIEKKEKTKIKSDGDKVEQNRRRDIKFVCPKNEGWFKAVGMVGKKTILRRELDLPQEQQLERMMQQLAQRPSLAQQLELRQMKVLGSLAAIFQSNRSFRHDLASRSKRSRST